MAGEAVGVCSGGIVLVGEERLVSCQVQGEDLLGRAVQELFVP